MNKGKKQLSQRMNKKIQKEVRKGLSLGPDYPTQEVKRELPAPKDILKGQPKRKKTIEIAHLKGLERSIEMKKAKKLKKRSKRTDPKDAVVGSTPAHVHAEGSRWIRTTVKQNKVRTKRLTKKMVKRK